MAERIVDFGILAGAGAPVRSIFGEMALIDHNPRSATAVAVN